MNMNAKKRITVEFAPDGSPKIEAHNFQGVGCAAATKNIEMVLAGGDSSAVDQKKKGDYWQTTGASNTVRG